MTCSCCASRLLEQARGQMQMIDADELWLHVPTCVAFRAFPFAQQRGCCAHWALPADSAPMFSSNHSPISPFHSSAVDPANLRLAQRQTCSCITSRAEGSRIVTHPIRQARRRTTVDSQRTCTQYVSIEKACMAIYSPHISSMFGIDELCATRLSYFSYPVRGEHVLQAVLDGQSRSFRGILVSNLSLTLR